jgi:glycosyltransferase involved in cell wall biosynthesis
MSRQQVSVIIPALNECESIGYVVKSMPWARIAECIVVDNGSTDGTAEVASAAGARVIHSARGYGSACSAGAAAALPQSTVLVFMDGDGSDVIEDMDRLMQPVLKGAADFAIGSRIRGRRQRGSMLPSQTFAGKMVSLILRFLYGAKYSDMGPFRAIRRSALQKLQMSEMTYGWNLEMQIKAVKHQLRICEIPVDYRRRLGGTSEVSGNLSASLRTAMRIILVLMRFNLSSGHPPVMTADNRVESDACARPDHREARTTAGDSL